MALSGRVAWGSLLVSLLVLAFAGSARPSAAQTEERGGAEEYPVGAYVTSLRDFDTANGSFGIDYWIWSVHPPGADPLANIEFVNAKEIDVRLERTIRRGDVSWTRLKVRSTVLHDWDLKNFPFDRQSLEVELREADPNDAAAYIPDTADSGYSEGIVLDGWRVTGFGMSERHVGYDTDFGDPADSGGISEESLVISTEVRREGVTGLFKFVAGVYAAVAIALLSFLILPREGTLFSARLAVLVGSLFATVLSLRSNDALLRRYEELSLVDKIHILAMVLVFGATLMTILSRRTCLAGKENLARQRDHRYLIIFGAVFALLNGILILVAIIVG